MIFLELALRERDFTPNESRGAAPRVADARPGRMLAPQAVGLSAGRVWAPSPRSGSSHRRHTACSDERTWSRPPKKVSRRRFRRYSGEGLLGADTTHGDCGDSLLILGGGVIRTSKSTERVTFFWRRRSRRRHTVCLESRVCGSPQKKANRRSGQASRPAPSRPRTHKSYGDSLLRL